MRGDDLFRELASRPPFSKLHPRMAAFLKDYLSREKAVRFGDQVVINTNFPPYPSPAFDRFAEGFSQAGSSAQRRLHSVTLAVTNRCSYKCWHCYNAGRSQQDLPLARLRELARELAGFGAVCVTLTGGEPLLRQDLEEVVSAFDSGFYLTLGTTGAGLTPERAAALKARGLFAVGISLDSEDEAEHDKGRGVPGAFRTALTALRTAREAGLYSYVVAVASPALLEESRFFSFLRFARDRGAYEVHLLEPCPIGRLKGQPEAKLSARDSQRILDYQSRVAQDDSLPALSAFAYIESPQAFGCGAGLTHLYIDGAGAVSPCNFVPLSFGSLLSSPLAPILERMGKHFRQPRTGCIGHLLSRHIPDGAVPASPDVSDRVCAEHLPAKHAVPRFFQVRAEAVEEAGGAELKAAYDAIHSDYDDFWLCEAKKPIEDLVSRLDWTGREKVFEAGCGTGYATALISKRLDKGGTLLSADLSAGMLSLARKRLAGAKNVSFQEGDALELLRGQRDLDLVITSWVLGYIPVAPFLQAAARALKPGGRLAFIVHQEDSPRRELRLFFAVGADDPAMLSMKVDFDFPTPERVAREIAAAGLRQEQLWEGAAVFRYGSPRQVMEHLLKSGAGTAYYNAVRPERRAEAEGRFLSLLEKDNAGKPDYEVRHDLVGCIARR